MFIGIASHDRMSPNIRQAALLCSSGRYQRSGISVKTLQWCSGKFYTFLGSLVVAPKLGVFIASGVALVRSSKDDKLKSVSSG